MNLGYPATEIIVGAGRMVAPTGSRLCRGLLIRWPSVLKTRVGCATKFFHRFDLAPEGRRKLAGGKLCAAPGGRPGTIAPRPGRRKVVNPSNGWIPRYNFTETPTKKPAGRILSHTLAEFSKQEFSVVSKTGIMGWGDW